MHFSSLKKPSTGAEPLKHVIDQYRHKEQTVTCVCGWHGSSAAPEGQTSEWSAHLVEMRGKKR